MACRSMLLSIAIVLLGCLQTQAEDRSIAYEARYQLVGFLIRAINVCGGNKADVDAAFSLLDSDELKAISRSFPKLTEKWMTKGAGLFNVGVMKDGVPSACNYALTVLKKATTRQRSP
jgi:hypothetical protein